MSLNIGSAIVNVDIEIDTAGALERAGMELLDAAEQLRNDRLRDNPPQNGVAGSPLGNEIEERLRGHELNKADYDKIRRVLEIAYRAR